MHPNIGNNQHLDDPPIGHVYTSSNHDGGDGGFFRNANQCTFYECKFTLVQGSMTTVSGAQQPPPVCKIESTTAPKTDHIQVENVSMGRLRSTNPSTFINQSHGYCDHGG